MALNDLRRTWDRLGREDPLWAVLSDPTKRNNRWNAEEFFRTGDVEIRQIFEDLDGRGFNVNRGRALDFGCGVGRLSQALCAYFDRVDGVDIASSMVKAARKSNKHGARCHYHLNVRHDLRLFDDGSFDLVYSNIVLQHMEPDLARGYIREFMRVLAPGGMAVFQVPGAYREPVDLPVGAHAAELHVHAHGDLVFRAGERKTVEVDVRNASLVAWPEHSRLAIGNHWLDEGGDVVILDDGRSRLPDHTGAGDQVPVELTVTAPAQTGSYLLEIDLVEEGVTWFAERGSEPVRLLASVAAGPAGANAAGFRAGIERVLAPIRRRRPDQPEFEMHAVPRGEVLDIVRSGGGEALDVVDCDVSGPGWDNYRYFVRKA